MMIRYTGRVTLVSKKTVWLARRLRRANDGIGGGRRIEAGMYFFWQRLTFGDSDPGLGRRHKSRGVSERRGGEHEGGVGRGCVQLVPNWPPPERYWYFWICVCVHELWYNYFHPGVHFCEISEHFPILVPVILCSKIPRKFCTFRPCRTACLRGWCWGMEGPEGLVSDVSCQVKCLECHERIICYVLKKLVLNAQYAWEICVVN